MQRQNLRVFVKQTMSQIGKHLFEAVANPVTIRVVRSKKTLLMLHDAIPNMCVLRNVLQEDSVQRYNMQHTCDLQHLLRNQIVKGENIITTQIRLILDSSGFLEIQK